MYPAHKKTMDMVWERKEGGKPATHTHKEERDQRSPSARFEKKEERRGEGMG